MCQALWYVFYGTRLFWVNVLGEMMLYYGILLNLNLGDLEVDASRIRKLVGI